MTDSRGPTYSLCLCVHLKVSGYVYLAPYDKVPKKKNKTLGHMDQGHRRGERPSTGDGDDNR